MALGNMMYEIIICSGLRYRYVVIVDNKPPKRCVNRVPFTGDAAFPRFFE